MGKLIMDRIEEQQNSIKVFKNGQYVNKDQWLNLTGILYLISNLTNGKKYFGISNRRFNQRYRGNWIKNVSNKHLKSAIAKFGADSFEIDILYINKTDTELADLEKQLINKYNTFDNNYGYNKTPGGEYVDYPKREFLELQNDKIYKLERLVNRVKNMTGDIFDFSEAVYTKARRNIKIRCKICNSYFYRSPMNLIHKKRKIECPKCHDNELCRVQLINKRLKLIEKINQRYGGLYEININSYFNNLSHVEYFCNNCCKYFSRCYSNPQIKCDCQKARYNAISYTNAIEKIPRSIKNNYNILKHTYKNTDNGKILIVCKKCNKSQEIKYKSLKAKTRICCNI